MANPSSELFASHQPSQQLTAFSASVSCHENQDKVTLAKATQAFTHKVKK